MAKRVRVILTVSEFSKGRIVDLLQCPEERVAVTHLGFDRNNFAPAPREEVARVKERYGIHGEYLITVSALSERKNLRRVLTCWERVRCQDLRLVIVGAQGLPFAGDFRFPGGDHTGVMYLGHVSDDDLVALYTGSLAALYLSLYEGFGLPALEAMACGAPLLTSNITALPEVVGDAALKIDPYDLQAIESGIARLIADSKLRDELRRKGLARAAQFSWEETDRKSVV